MVRSSFPSSGMTAGTQSLAWKGAGSPVLPWTAACFPHTSITFCVADVSNHQVRPQRDRRRNRDRSFLGRALLILTHAEIINHSSNPGDNTGDKTTAQGNNY